MTERFKAQFPQASLDAINLLIHLLHFEPDKRLTAEEALEHPYIGQFHDKSVERVALQPVRSRTNDDMKMSTAYYRDELYKMVRSGWGGQRSAHGSDSRRGPSSGR